MNASAIAVEIAIGLALIVVGFFLQEPLKRLRNKIRDPGPLTPQSRGQWTSYVAQLEQSLERVNYLNAHPRDLYLYLLQLILAAIALDGIALVLFIWAYANPTTPQREFWLVLSIVPVAIGVVLAFLGIIEGKNLSQKQIDTTRSKLQTQIERYQALLANKD
jgi:hypothetical protein